MQIKNIQSKYVSAESPGKKKCYHLERVNQGQKPGKPGTLQALAAEPAGKSRIPTANWEKLPPALLGEAKTEHMG